MTDGILSTTYIIIALTIITMHISTYESYNLKCPSHASWKIRANVTCNSILKYTCLFNNVEKKYVEGCRGPDWDRKGSKRIFSGFFTRGKCNQSRFQPFKFQTNASMSDCVYAKSSCSEVGQIMQNNDSAKSDTTCRCNHRKNFSFVTSPRNWWYCIPIEEDCSCYVKSCPVNFTLSSEYECIQNNYMDNRKYPEKQQNETLDWKTEFKMNLNDTTSWTMLGYQTAATILCCLVMFIVGGFFLAVLIWSSQTLQSTNRDIGMQQTADFKQWTRETVEILKRYLRRLMRDPNEVDNTDEVYTFGGNSVVSCTSLDKEQNITERIVEGVNNTSKRYAVEADSTDNKIQLVETDGGSKDEACTFVDQEENFGDIEEKTEQTDAQVHQPTKMSNLPTEEKYFLRIIHLLFRVAGPVVRLIFDNVIQPDKLQKTLNENKVSLEKLYRKKDKAIEDFQWDLLFPKVKGKIVTSEDFDIRLMICILHAFKNHTVSDNNHAESDTNMFDMLSIINNYRNVIIRKFDGKLLETQFNQYWEGICRAVRNLVSSTSLVIVKNKEQTMSLIDCFNVKTVPIPQSFLHRHKKITDITTDENNFLVVVHGLTQIVQILIKSEIKKQYDKPDERADISTQQTAKFSKDLHKKGKKKKKTKSHRTQDHQSCLYSYKKEETENLYFESMINILKQTSRYKGDNIYNNVLNAMEEIRREIIHNSSGTLNQTRFEYITNRIRKAVWYLGGKNVEDELSRIQHIVNILE